MYFPSFCEDDVTGATLTVDEAHNPTSCGVNGVNGGHFTVDGCWWLVMRVMSAGDPPDVLSFEATRRDQILYPSALQNKRASLCASRLPALGDQNSDSPKIQGLVHCQLLLTITGFVTLAGVDVYILI